MKKQIGSWALWVWRIVSGTYGTGFHPRMWDVEMCFTGPRKLMLEVARKIFFWSLKA